MSHPTKLAPLVDFDAEEAPARGRAGARAKAPAESRWRQWLNSNGGRAAIGLGFVLIIAFAVWRTWSAARDAQPQWPRVRLMNAETGELRWFRTGEGKKLPVGYHPIEYCFQNECGPAGGTPVVLNVYLGKKDPTHCPKCGALVVGHNPRPPEYVGVLPAAER